MATKSRKPTTPFGRWLREQVDKLGAPSDRQAAKLIGISHGALYEYIYDGREPGRRATARLAEFFGVEVDELNALIDAGRPEGPNSGSTNNSSFTESLRPANNGGPSGDRALILAIQLHNRASHLTIENFRELQVGLDTLLERLEAREQE